MKVQITKSQQRVVHASDVQVGEIGRVVNAKGDFQQFAGHIVVRCYGVLVSLTNPNKTWDEPNFAWPQFDVELLHEGSEVLLTV